LRIADGIADCGLRIADCGLRIADCGLRIADCGLRIARTPEHFAFRISHFAFPTSPQTGCKRPVGESAADLVFASAPQRDGGGTGRETVRDPWADPALYRISDEDPVVSYLRLEDLYGHEVMQLNQSGLACDAAGNVYFVGYERFVKTPTQDLILWQLSP
jgi:hypothetical protein